MRSHSKWNDFTIFKFSRSHGSQKGSQEGRQGPHQDPQEEGGGRRRQGQEEEVVQGKVQGQAQQPGPLRQGIPFVPILLDEFYLPNISQMLFSVSFMFRLFYVIMQLFFSVLTFGPCFGSGLNQVSESGSRREKMSPEIDKSATLDPD